MGDRAKAFLNEQASSGQPWLLFCSFIHPHPPFSPPAPWHKLYRAPLMPLPHIPPDSEALHTAINRVQNRYKYRDQGFDHNLVRCLKAYYYAAVSFIDYQVGRILQTLEESGQLERTLILFTSDHGELLGDYGCFGKRSMHDACARVPLLARLPGRFAPDQRCAVPVSLVDVMPTLLGAAEVPYPAMGLDGEDLAAVAAGKSTRPYVYSQFQRAEQAIYIIVGERWKYAYSAPDNQEYLFDRRQDPLETRNLAGVVFCEAARQQMQDELMGYLRSVGETNALDGNAWKMYPRHQMPLNPDAGLSVQDAPWAETEIPGYT